MKRVVSLLLSLSLLAGLLVLPVAADGSEALTTAAYDTPVRYSVTDSNLTGWGLAFCFTLSADNVKKNATTHTLSLTNATLTYQGEACAVTRIGAVVTNRKEVGEDAAAFTRAAAEVDPDQVKDAKVTKACDVTDTSCEFAVRVINVPYTQENQLIYARPYVEISCGGETVTLYGATASSSYATQAQKLEIKLPYYGADIDGKGRLTVGETAVVSDTLYLEIVDELDDWMVIYDPTRLNVIYYACYDAAGNELSLSDEDYGMLYLLEDMGSTNSSEYFEIPLPEGTAEVKIVDTEILYWSEWEDYA